MSAQIFLSHASKDQKIARTICNALESRGFKCWIASRDIGPGENFMEAIVRAIRSAKVMVLVFSGAANNSDEIKREVVLAGQNKLVVIPVRVEDVMPNDALAYQFATRQWIDLFEDWEQQVERLTSWIGSTLQITPTAPATVTPQKPAAPASNDQGAEDIRKKEELPSVSDDKTAAAQAPEMDYTPRWINITAPITLFGLMLFTWWLTLISLGPAWFANARWVTGSVVGVAILVSYALALFAQSLSASRRAVAFNTGKATSAPQANRSSYKDITAFGALPLIFAMAAIIGYPGFGANHAAVITIIAAPFSTIAVLLFTICAATQTLVHLNILVERMSKPSARYIATAASTLLVGLTTVTAIYALFRINVY